MLGSHSTSTPTLEILEISEIRSGLDTFMKYRERESLKLHTVKDPAAFHISVR